MTIARRAPIDSGPHGRNPVTDRESSLVEKVKVRLLIAIWGARYIEEFARVSLPSYLAPGNLPALASETDFEMLILTSKDSLPKFEEEPIFGNLRRLCSVRFVCIDDLIASGVYGVTLTLAFARGIRESGSDQTNTCFVFMNSDFVLADGSLRTLVARLRAGHRCIMAPSLRATAEAVFPTLRQAVDPFTGALSLTPRQMVRLALDNLHPTAIAKTVTQGFITSRSHNQVYWQVDENTLLGRYFLIFMLAIRPGAPIRQVNSYCDYGFVPELVPSGEFSILGDSDEFFMLEMQSAGQERDFLRCGRATYGQIAADLSAWTTREHRRFADVDVIFRAGDLPPGLTQAREGLAKFIANVKRHIRVPPLSHIHHFYWTMGVEAWLSLRNPKGTDPVELPPELAYHRPRTSGLLITNVIAMARRLAGAVPNVPVWHHRWLDSRLVLRWAEAVKVSGQRRNLLVCETSSSLPNALRRLVPLDVRVGLGSLPRDGDRGDREVAAETEKVYDNVLVHVYRANVRQTRSILETLERRVKAGGTITIFIDHVDGELDGSNFSVELAQYVEHVLPARWMGYLVDARFAGGRLKRRLRRAEASLLRHISPRSVRWLPSLALAAAMWPAVATLTVLNNLRLRRNFAGCPQYCSSALLSLKPAPTVAPDSSAERPQRRPVNAKLSPAPALGQWPGEAAGAEPGQSKARASTL